MNNSDRGFSRRAVLGGTAAAAASSLLPWKLRQAMAATPAHVRGSLRDIEHIVILMQENRSFDHYFGTLSGVRGFDDHHALRLPNGDPVWRQPDPSTSDGYLLPYRLNSRISAAQAIPSMSHAWSVQHSAWNNGAMDNWLPVHRAADGNNGPYTMGT